MNKLNKELLDRALVEGVDESCWDYTSLSFSLNGIFTGFHTTKQSTESSLWQYVCTKEEYLAAKAEKESRKTVMDAVNYYNGKIDKRTKLIHIDAFGQPYFLSSCEKKGQKVLCLVTEFNETIEECETNFGTSLPYAEYKKGYKLMQDTVSEYDIGCYYEFSDDSDFDYYQTMVLSSVNKGKFNKYPYVCSAGNAYEYMRPLTAKAGEIRKPKPLVGFINLYGDFNGYNCVSAYKTREDADNHDSDNRIACIDLSQFNEGEGIN